MAHGRLPGVISGLGSASADGIYGLIAAFGLTFISDLLIDNQTVLRIIGGAFLLYLGYTTLLAKPAEESVDAHPMGGGLIGMYLSTLFLTLTNPITVLFFTAIFAGMGAAAALDGYDAAVVLVIGVFSGSAAWWLFLSLGVSLLRSRFNARVLLWINRVSGLLILAFGAFALISAL